MCSSPRTTRSGRPARRCPRRAGTPARTDRRLGRMAARVGIVGAGPVGVVAAIACARKGMHVTLFEAEREIDHSPRAATTHPSTLEMLAQFGASRGVSVTRPGCAAFSVLGRHDEDA